MKTCARCGDSRRLRYDRGGGEWLCVVACAPSGTPARRVGRKRPALFDGFWRDKDGYRIQRVSRDELREAHRLWTVHSDVREGRVQ